MFQTLKNAWKITELRKKILYTLFMLLIYRVLCFIPTPGVDTSVIASALERFSLLGFINQMTGADLANYSIMAMGITPYINASIIMQLLCVYHLKQTLRLNDVKALTGRDDVDFAACYEHLLADKKRMREAIPPLLTAQLPETPDDPEERLCTCLALSEIANYLRRLCESMIDDIPQQTEGD